MTPNEERQPASPSLSEGERTHLTNSPKSSSPHLLPATGPSGIRIPEGVRPSGRDNSIRHASPPPELSSTVTTRQTDASNSDDDVGLERLETVGDDPPRPRLLLDWLVAQRGTLRAKLGAFNEFKAVEFEAPRETAVEDAGSSLGTHIAGDDEGGQREASRREFSSEDKSPQHMSQEQQAVKDSVEKRSSGSDEDEYMMTGAMPPTEVAQAGTRPEDT
ncbi:uncharacterized protein EKO05_0003106 [Ascochyta rabiei]|uniref:uncharacterized protein n=1 Tax=Didymella rabiei TaxID=5454 RepID=UPI0018FF71B0|nr:uncharacterized protein EKO05_0003106 [Ascochyta rabiei]UPX12561.1 hypothetical protein EKO05_0003106 [Ascochyta rabiei]